MLNIAIIGTGPTAIYSVKYLLAQTLPMSITIYESQTEAGKGTPYHQDWNTDNMLANIASIEIPPVTETLVDWLNSLDDYDLTAMGLTKAEIDDRTFYPRVVLGKFFQSQLQKLAALAHTNKIPFKIKVRTLVKDVAAKGNKIQLNLENKKSQPLFSHVIMATGHAWLKKSQVKPGYFISPWPPTELKTIGNYHVGILGTSLSAIDALVMLAVARGTFWRSADGVLNYLPEPGTENFKVTLMSRKGLLPEADFYFPIPYNNLKICTPERIDELIKLGKNNLLDSAFMLFKAELAKSDPEYAKKTKLAHLSLEEFAQEYFREREEHDPFTWAAKNLAEAKANEAAKHTVEWRYAILKMHEVIARIVPHLTANDHQRFSRFFKHIFVDDYATVPHESIERILALHEVGKLDIIKLGADYKLNSDIPQGGTELEYNEKTIYFPAFIDATGQRTLSARDFPFQSLLRQGIIKNATAKNKAFEIGGIALDMAYHPLSNSPDAYRLYCPSIPFMLGQFPFVQGITSSHDIGKVIAEDIGRNNVTFLSQLQANY